MSTLLSNIMKDLLSQLRLMLESMLSDTTELLLSIIKTIGNLILSSIRFIVEKAMSFLDDPFRAMLIVWTIVFLLAMTR